MRKILLIDDDQISNFLHEEVLRQADPSCEVIIFRSSLEGLEFLNRAISSGENIPDYLFLDIRMPEMSGFELLDELVKLPEENLRKMKIYMLTSSLDEKDKLRSEEYPIIAGFRGKTLNAKMLNEIFNA
ncbi:MAG: response regulator [Bacteroidetes bacterium]|nr:response regulator [Bacteroidota bacterium]